MNKFENIPSEMKSLPNWVVYEHDSKKPLIPGTTYGAKANDASTWRRFEEAMQSVTAGTAAGVGFELGDSPFVGIDLDHCVTDGIANDEAHAIIEALSSYTELSPSGTGIHIIIRADYTDKGIKLPGVEIYSQGRYLRMTGDIYQGRDTIKERTNELIPLIEKVTAGEEKTPVAKQTPAPPAALPTEKEEIIDLICRSKQGEKFKKLFYDGDIAAYGNDDSGADMALMNMLPFWTGGNIPLMIDIFSSSALARREKWQREDYRTMTAQKAIKSWNGKTYDPNVLASQHAEQDKLIKLNSVDKTDDELKQLAHFEFSDTGNAERLMHLFGGDLKYVTAMDKWLVWDNTRWRPCESKHNVELFNRVSVTMRLTSLQYDRVYGESMDKEAEAKKKAFLSFCKRSENQNSISNAIKRAAAFRRVDIGKLDSNPWLLNCENGTIDLKTGDLLPHDRGDLITQICSTSYDRNARSELWEQTVNQIMPDKATRDFMQRYIGYCLTGLTREEKFMFLYGEGGGGKGTFIETIGKILGSYADTIPIDILLAARNDGNGSSPTPEIAKLVGKRLALASESGQGRRFNDAKIKWLTGSDALTARFLHQNPFTFTPKFKIVMASNFMPAVTNVKDKGIKRRLLIVPFSAKLDGVRDVTLKERLLLPQERPGILKWCVQGCLHYQQVGLGTPPIGIRKMMEDYYIQNDVVGEFIDECCETGDGLRVKSRDLYKEFSYIMGGGTGWHKMAEASFKEDMKSRGFKLHKFCNGLHFLGIQLKQNPTYGTMHQGQYHDKTGL